MTVTEIARPPHTLRTQFVGTDATSEVREENSPEVASLKASIRALCARHTAVTMHQLIPENILLPACLFETNNGPSFLEILPTDLCNHGCEWCFTASSRSTRVLEPQKLRHHLEQFLTRGGKTLLLSGGGEPLLFKALSFPTKEFDGLTAVNWLIQRDVTVGLITNGVSLDRFINANSACLSALAFIRLTLDAHSSSSYKLLHKAREDDFERVICGVRMAIKARGESSTPAIGISFIVNGHTGMNISDKELLSIHRLGCNLGVDFVQLKHTHTHREVDADLLMQRLSEHAAIIPQDGPQWWIHRYLSAPAETECSVPLVSQVLRADGRRSPCCHTQDFEVPEPSGMVDFSKFSIVGCHSSACRYASMNRLLKKVHSDDASYIQALRQLKCSLERDGFHPYRMFPSAPDLASFHPSVSLA